MIIPPMHISARAIELLKVLEEKRPKPYRCSAGVMTVGIGHVIQEGDDFTYPMDEHTMELVLREDLKRFEAAVNKGVSSHITLVQYQFDALVSFAFNIGVYAFLKKATALDMVNAGRHIDALDWIRKWNKVTDEDGKHECFGLVVRREMECMMYSGKLEEARVEDFDIIKEKMRQKLKEQRKEQEDD